jgi:pimeloyl-ACP methyl ester carboxylesterase
MFGNHKNRFSKQITAALAGAAMAGVASCSPSGQQDVAIAPTINMEACRYYAFDRMYGNMSQEERDNLGLTEAMGDATCGTMEVYENRDTMAGRQISLDVIVLPALGPKSQHEPDPLFLFMGGPGGAISSSARLSIIKLGPLREKRQIVLVDQRGTGRSTPLACNSFRRVDPQSALAEILPINQVRACREELEKDHDLAYYTTPYAIDDIEDVRQALGYDKINLRGSSYGTRPILAYMRKFGGNVRTAMIQGVSDTTALYPLEFSQAAQSALDIVFEACLAEEACSAAYPDPAGDLERALARFDDGPVNVELTIGEGEAVQSYVLNRDVLAERLRSMMYSAAGAVLIPAMVNYAAETGDYSEWAISAYKRRSRLVVSDSFSPGMWLSVTCIEDTPFISAEAHRAMTANSVFGDYRVRRHIAACNEWASGALPDGYKTHVTSDVPTLAIAGAFDPATPPWETHAAVAGLTNSLLVDVFEGHGSTDGACTVDVQSRFIDAGTVEGLDISCLDEVVMPPFRIRGRD